MTLGFAWLAMSLSGGDHHFLPAPVYWHARLMVLGWNILLPLGMLTARFLKLPRPHRMELGLDHKLWWRGHIALQCTGVAIMSVGALMLAGRGRIGTQAATLHHWLGWILVGMGWSQVFSGMLRGSKGGPNAATLRGDHYDMTLRRLIFEYVHKLVGWMTIPLVIMATGIGLVVADAPRWMPVVLALWWLVLGACFVWLQRAGYCIDTYQAIWGTDPIHPGNARAPIGWGMRRRKFILIQSSDAPTGQAAHPHSYDG